jgi:hypothetical protein
MALQALMANQQIDRAAGLGAQPSAVYFDCIVQIYPISARIRRHVYVSLSFSAPPEDCATRMPNALPHTGMSRGP